MRQKIIQLKTFLFTPKCRFSIRNSQIPAMSNLTESCFPSKPKSNCTDFISLLQKHIYPEYICLRLNLSWHFLPSRFSIKHKHSWVFDLVFFQHSFYIYLRHPQVGGGVETDYLGKKHQTGCTSRLEDTRCFPLMDFFWLLDI